MGVYCTTFCNHAHRLADGKPVNHNCYILDAVKLRQEASGTMPDGSMIKEFRDGPRQMARGTRK